MNTISFVIPSYNNLRYVKNAYDSIRDHLGKDHEVIILDDASTDMTLDYFRVAETKDENLVLWENPTGNRLGHTILYNVGVELASNDIFSIFHADMYAAPGYVENLVKHLKKGTVVSATRIEPPLHPPGHEKVVNDFGMWPEDFEKDNFLEFVERMQKKHANETTRGIFAPWAMYREDFLAIGGHDPLFAPFPYEDSDIFQRFILAGYDIVQSRDSYVYHLTCRGHKWTDDEELGKLDQDYNIAEENARKNWMRKWNNWIQNDPYSYPVMKPQYDICLVVNNPRPEHTLFEMFFQRLILIGLEDTVQEYIRREQPNTMLDLSERISTDLSDADDHDVVITIDMNRFTQQDLDNLRQINMILEELNNEMGSDQLEGEYKLGGITVNVKRLRDLKKQWIICPRDYNEVLDV